jgi:hypothetical protein
MGSSYFPQITVAGSYSFTGPTGPVGETGSTGSTGYGPTGNTGPSITGIGLCGDKLRTTFSTGFTYETVSSARGITGDTLLIAGISSPSISFFEGVCGSVGGTLTFRPIRGSVSTSGRAELTIGLSGDEIYIDYVNQSSGFTVGITGSETILTFVGYSGSTLASIPKTVYGSSSSIATKNVIEKIRGLGFSGATSSAGLTCNYISGGTLTYVNSDGYIGYTACKILQIHPDCISNNSVDVQIMNRMFIADMKNSVTRVTIGSSAYSGIASAFSLIVMNASNGPTAIGQGERRFQLSSATGSIMWPFNQEPCFCGQSGTNVYHFYNMGGFTWYGSVASMTDVSKFFSCPNGNIIKGITNGFGSCCINDGTSGGTCSYRTQYDCGLLGASAYWHDSVLCSGTPCGKTGACCLKFTSTLASDTFLCIPGVTCINCISGRVYDAFGNTYNATSFTYLGNGSTCPNQGCGAEIEGIA